MQNVWKNSGKKLETLQSSNSIRSHLVIEKHSHYSVKWLSVKWLDGEPVSYEIIHTAVSSAIINYIPQKFSFQTVLPGNCHECIFFIYSLRRIYLEFLKNIEIQGVH